MYRTLLITLCFVIATSVNGALVNPSFEQGLVGWSHDVSTYPQGNASDPYGTAVLGTTTSRVATVSLNLEKNAIQNGSFESGLSLWQHDPSATTILAGVDGTTAANLGTFDQLDSFLSQSFEVQGCNNYRVTFYSAANGVNEIGLISKLEVSVILSGGVSLVSQVFTDVSAGLPYGAKGFSPHEFQFVSPAESQTLTLRFRDVSENHGTAIDQMIDNVRVQSMGNSSGLTAVLPKKALGFEDAGAAGALRVPIRLQEIYSATDLPPGPILIREIRFRPDSTYGFAYTGTVSRIQFTLSTSSRKPGQLSSVFDENLGLDKKVVFDGPWTLSTAFTGPPNGPKAFDLALPLQQTFHYDPTKGSLLVEIRNYSGLPVVFNNDSSATASSVQRVFFDGSPDAATASAGDSGADVLQLIYCTDITAPPVITSVTGDTTARVGTDVTFSVSASGGVPLLYQWMFNGTLLLGATNSDLVLGAVSPSQSGDYSVSASNAFGSVTSAPSHLTITLPPTLLRVVDTAAESGGDLSLPIEMIANGSEAGMAFTLVFNPRTLRYQALEFPLGLPAVAFGLNTNDAAIGRVGLEFALDAGATVKAGRIILCSLKFQVLPVSGSQVTDVDFSSETIVQEVVDVNANPMLSQFVPGKVSVVFGGYEGDLRPRGKLDNRVTVSDWIQMGRFVSGLDKVNDLEEFRRADCAPRLTRGDGRLTMKDWIQAGRYAAGVDAAAPVGGPNRPTPPQPPSPILQTSSASQVSIGAATIAGGTAAYPVTLNAVGLEAGVGFSLRFDPGVLSFVEATPGSDSGALTLDSNGTAARFGRVGFAMALPNGFTFEPGPKHILTLRFTNNQVLGRAASFSFTDDPVVRDIVSGAAESLEAIYDGVNVEAVPLSPSISYAVVSAGIELSWSSEDPGYQLEFTDSLASGAWAPINTPPLPFGDRLRYTASDTQGQKYFRLRKP